MAEKQETQYIPHGYTADDRLGIRKEIVINEGKEDEYVKYEDVSYSNVWIEKTLKNHDTNEISLQIGFIDHRGRTEFQIMPMGSVFQKKGIMELAGFGVKVDEKRAGELAKYLNLYLHSNVLQEEKLYETLGWKNDNTIFVMGNIEISKGKEEPITITNAPKSLTDAISTKGDLKLWLEMTRKILKYELTRFKCYLACSAPLLAILEQKSRIINNYGDSSIGKTVSGEVGMSIWGNPESLNLTAITTKVGAEEVIKLFSNIPVNLDDVQAADPELFSQIIYMIGNEAGKLRGKKSGGLRDAARWKTIVFATGEASLKPENRHFQ